jgi:dipeptidyl aminopeptidase/acylaminoacyl peptidase
LTRSSGELQIAAEEPVMTRSLVLAVTLSFAAVAAADPSSGYRLPPPDLVKLADAAPPPFPVPGPDDDWLLLLTYSPLLPLEEVSQPELKLAGLRFNPERHAVSRTLYFDTARFTRLSQPATNSVTGLPPHAHLRDVSWSPDGQRVAFAVTTDRDVELWIAERATGAARRIGDVTLNASHPSPSCFWLPDGKALICRALPAEPGAPPAEPRLPSGPITDENLGKKSPAPTWEDLLKTEYDAALFEHMMRAEVVRVDLDGKRTRLLPPDLIVRAEPSPDGAYLLVETLHRPFSYLVREDRFPRRFEIRRADGKLVKLVADVPLADQVPVDFSAVRTGRRELGWRSDAPATLSWVEAQDGGDPKRPAKVRDKLFAWKAPFATAPVELLSMSLRFESVQWGTDDLAIVTETWWKDRSLREWRVAPGSPALAPRLLSERSFEDRYADPGKPQLHALPSGRLAIRVDGGKTMFRIGDGYSPEGVRPFIDAIDLSTAQTTRLFRSQAPYFERPIVLRADAHHLLTRRESVDDPPNYFVRDLTSQAITRITNEPHPYPMLKGTKKELIKYTRKDGVGLTGTLYTPPGYKPGTRLPVLLWAYPEEFKSAAAASQVQDSPYRFPRVSTGSPLFWLVRGFAILDNPSFPIVGEGKREPNDNYVDQLVADAQAAVDELVRRGVGDRERMAIGGHSYGAFTTANLLAHSRLFRAGIARSGAYNRTLTPFGFQREERTFWEARPTYIEMSPFTHAASIEDPLLLIHGQEDENSGTYTIQSQRLFAALKGLGKTSRLVLLPHEGHGYRARASIMHMLFEMDAWLDKYVKHAPPRAKDASASLR